MSPRQRRCYGDGWGTEVVEAFFAVNDIAPPARLCVTNRVGLQQGAHSVRTQIYGAIRDAGLGSTPGVTAGSIRLTAAAGVLAQDRIEAAARFLGSRSLDSTAAALGDMTGTDTAPAATGASMTEALARKSLFRGGRADQR